MVIFQLLRLFSIKLDGNIIIKGEDWKDGVMAYFKVLHLKRHEKHQTYQAGQPLNQPQPESHTT
jgi:hypothetical protein